MSDIAVNFEQVHAQINKAAQEAGRNPRDVALIAVSKMQPATRVRDALVYGHRLFGENRVQDAAQTWAALKEEFPDVRLHLIGPLQTNKAKEAVALFDCIETIDREKLADALAGEMAKQGRTPACYIQVNTGDEEQKAGVSVDGLPALLTHCQQIGLKISGLMCIPPVNEPPAFHFAMLQKLAVHHGLVHLSMGMSGDFERAIALGATHVRVGTRLFGDRL